MTDSEHGSAGKKPQFGVIFLTVFVDLIGFSIIFPLFPAMLEHYVENEPTGGLFYKLIDLIRSIPTVGQDQTVVFFGGVLGSLYSLLQFMCAPIWGSLSDRVGRRPVLLMTIGGIAISYLIWFMSGSFMLLVLSRLLGGVMSGNLSVATAAIADSTDSSNRSKGMGIIGAAFGLGFVLGPAIGGTLFVIETKVGFSQSLSWVPGINPFSLPALTAMILSIWNVIWVARKFRETLPEELQEKSARRVNPLVLFQPTGIAGVTRTNLIYFLFLLAFAGMEFTLTFLAKERFAYGPADIAIMFVFIGLIIAFVQGGIVRRIAPKYGEKRVSLVGLVLVAPGLLVVGYCTSVWQLYVGLGLLSVGSALALPTLTALVSLYAPENRQGEILGVFRSLGALSRAVGPIVACLIYWRFGSEWPYLVATLFLILPIALALGLPAQPDRAQSH